MLAASGAGATLLADPMVDPRGGAYTVGFGLVSNLAVFPHHGTAPAHLLERSLELLPRRAFLAVSTSLGSRKKLFWKNEYARPVSMRLSM